MKLDRNAFARVLAAARTIIPTKSPRANLLEALLVERDGTPRFRATDFSRGIDVPVMGDAEKGERHMLPIAEACSALATIEDDRVEVTTDDGRVTLASPTARWTWGASDPQDAGSHAGPDRAAPLVATLPLARLSECLARVAWCVGIEDSRYTLRYALLEVGRGEARATATHGKALAQDRFPVDGELGAVDISVLIEPGAVAALVAAIGESEKVAIHSDGAGRVEVHSGGARVWILGVNGHFPPYEGVIPKSESAPAVLDAGALRAAITRARLATVKESRGVALAFSGSHVVVSAHNHDRSSNGGRVPFTGDSQHDTMLDGGFVTSALAGIEGEMSLWHTSETRPVLLRAAPREGWLCVIMPITTG